MRAEIIDEVRENQRQGRTFALITVIDTEASSPRHMGAQMIVYPDGQIAGTIGGGTLEATIIKQAVKAIEDRQSQKVVHVLEPEELGMYCGGRAEFFIHVYHREFHLIQFGAGHVGEAVARIAEVIGRPYTVVDDRPEYANPEKFSLAEEVVCADFSAVFEGLTVDENCYLSIITRGHAADGVVLKQALQTPARYIGMIGSKTKIKRLCAEIAEEIGENPLDDPRVYAPIGLQLGTSSPGDIAVSVWSELLKIQSSGTGDHMRIKGER